MALPGKGASLVMKALEPLAERLRTQRRKTNNLVPHPAEKAADFINRSPLEGGRIWCINPNCATCMVLEKWITTSNGEISVGRILLLLISLGFIKSLKSDYKRYRMSLPDEAMTMNI